MHGKGNYTNQAGQGPYPPPPPFQQNPVAAAAPPPHLFRHGPHPAQPQGFQQGRPSFQLPRGSNLVYPHSLPGPPRQGLPWNQNVHQFPPMAPIPAPRTYPMPSSQGYTIDRAQAHQTQNVSLPPRPLCSSGSDLSTPDSYRSSMMVPQHSSLHPLGPLPPPPLLPPPPPLVSPPGAPPLPPSSPPSDNLSKNDGSHSLKEDISYEDNLMLEHPFPMRVAEDSSADKPEVLYQNGPEMKVVEDVSIHSPADSDMDMEDDIIQSADENQKVTSKSSNDGCISLSQELDAENQLEALDYAGENILPNIAADGFIPFTGSPVSKDLRVGCEEYSEDDDLGMTLAEKMEQPMDVNVKISPSQHQDFPKPAVPVGVVETGFEKISSPLSEGETANPFELLQGYVTDNSTENEIENLHGDVSTSVSKVESTNFDIRDGCDQLLKEPRLKILLESNNLVSSKCMTNKISLATVEVESSTDKSNGNKKYVGVEDGSFNKRDVKSNSAKSNVDEFGRLVRKGDSDSDTSDSPSHTRKHARRDRRRSRSLSSSRSPHYSRRRSPWKRKERRDRFRSLSPKRRRNRTRSPVLKRGSERRDVRREPVTFQECFDFRRGKCYRGATCRYSHHESDKNERSRYNRGKQQYQDLPPTSWNPDLHEESKIRPLSISVHENKEVKDEELKLSQDMPNLKEVKDIKELLADPAMHPHGKLNSRESSPVHAGDIIPNNLPGYSSQNVLAGNGNSLIQESHTENPDKISRIDSLISGSCSPGQPSKATLTHLTADKADVKQNPAGETWSAGSPMTKPYVSEPVPSQLNIYFPPVSQVTNVPVAQPIFQGHNSMPPNIPFNSKPEIYPSYLAPVPYQSSHFSVPSNSSSNSFLLPLPPPPPPPPPPPHQLTANVTTGQQGNLYLPKQQSFLLPSNGSSNTSMRPYPTDLPNQSHTGYYEGHPGVSNITSQLSVTHANGEDRLNRYSDQGVNPLHPVSQSQSNPLLMQTGPNGMHASSGSGNVFSNTNSSHSLPYFQQGSYSMQYIGPYGVSSQLSESHSRLPDFAGPGISNHFNPYASTFDQPLGTKFSLNASIHENDKPFNSVYGVSSVSVDAHKIGSFSSKNMVSSSSSARPAGGNQYDPLFDSIEPSSNSFNGSKREKNETLGGSDNFTRYSGIRENFKQEGVFVSVSGSIENEEYGETADAEVDDVVNGGSPSSNPNDAGDIEIDQVKGYGKKKGKDSKSSKFFKNSIAAFVKEVLKPSWRQGNMSKEAFKTIVKKTVDKVSGAMKSHPKSQAKINHYIDSSRGKLTKLVMGYVDKYAR